MKKIPKKNYIITAVICLSTIIIVSYFAYWYIAKNKYQQQSQVMPEFLLKFGEDEIIDNITNYVLDNPECVIYISYNVDDNTYDFERELKDFIEQKNIKSSFAYIDLNNIKNKKFLDEFSERFFSPKLKAKNIKLIKQSNVFAFKDGVISDILYYNRQNINMSDVRSFLLKQGVYAND